ncbi:unnamed protein product [Orchesella dallaii]|uniref:RING-type E3 ubiquitin transferase n=1 Tax=Orchesella dallaii TaxID=48710 RepID=A0ABP1Q6L2_9HEXA
MSEVEKLVSQDQLIKLLECPVCYEFPAPPLFSCERGHFTCSACMRFLKSCSICRGHFAAARNFAVESIIEGSYFKCRNAYAGCTEVIKGDKLNSHLSQCLFRPFDCPEVFCSTKNLQPTEYLEHMKRHHHAIGCQEKLKDGKVAVAFMGMPDWRYKPCYINVFHPKSKTVVTFLVFSKYLRCTTFSWVTCPHPKFLSLYNVRFSLGSQRDVKNLSVHWTLPVLPIYASFNELRDSGLCAVIPDTQLASFYTKDSKSWNLKVEIIEKEETQPESFIVPLIQLLLILVTLVGILLWLYCETSTETKKNPIKSYNPCFPAKNYHYKCTVEVILGVDCDCTSLSISNTTVANNTTNDMRQICFN